MKIISDIKNIIIRIQKDKFFFFNDKGIFAEDLITNIANYPDIKNPEYLKIESSPLKCSNAFYECFSLDIDKQQFNSFIRKLKVGMHLSTIENYIFQCEERMKMKEQEIMRDMEELDRFITKYNGPFIQLEDDMNRYENFHHISIQIFVLKYKDNKEQFIERTKYEIRRRALDKIATNDTFKKCKCSVDDLVVQKMTLRKTDIIDMIFVKKGK